MKEIMAMLSDLMNWNWSNLLLIASVVLLLGSAGCSVFNTRSTVRNLAEEELISYSDLLVLNDDAERILEYAFSNSDIPWSDEGVLAIDISRKSIDAMRNFLKTRLELDSSIPYYTYKVSFEFVQNQYNILQRVLDRRIEVEGTITPEARVIYYYVKRDILARLFIQQQKIAVAKKSIDDKASKSTIDEMRHIFSAIKPLIDMAL